MDSPDTVKKLDTSTLSTNQESAEELEQLSNKEMSSDTIANPIDTNNDIMNQSEREETKAEMSESKKAQLNEVNFPSPKGSKERLSIPKGYVLDII